MRGYVSFFTEQGLRSVKPEFRSNDLNVCLDGDFTLRELRELVAEFERRLEALPGDLKPFWWQDELRSRPAQSPPTHDDE